MNALEFDGARLAEHRGLFGQTLDQDVDRVVVAASGYGATLRRLLCAVDAEVLRLYALPAWAERRLLDLFADSRRNGVPFDFGAYYPPDFKDAVPLYAFLSKTYQRFLKTGEPEVTNDLRERYDVLVDQRLSGELSPKHDDELYRLEAEMDGSDYAANPPDDSWRKAREAERGEAERKLDGIANRIADLVRTGGPADAHHP